jgi:drug/metabolite transporter (DMT)-like permease
MAPRSRWTGILALFVVMCACGIGGPMFDLVEVPPIVRNSWRSQISAMFLFPSLCWSCCTDDSIRWTKTVILTLFVVGVCLELSYATWNIALEMTTFPRTALFAQVHPVFILLGAACAALVSRRRRHSQSELVTFPSRTEWFGVGVTVSGAIITTTYSNRRDQQRPSTIAGDLVALCSAIFYAGYIASMRRWFTNASVFIVQGFATIIMMMCSFLILVIVPDQADWSLTSPYGVFAWPHCDDVRFIIAVGVLIALGHLAITVAIQNLPLLVASVSLTLLPIVQTLFSHALVGTPILTVREIVGAIVTILGVALTTVAHESLAEKHREDSRRITINNLS